MVPSWADRLLPQLLMEQFDMLPIQYRHIEHMHKGVWFGKCIDGAFMGRSTLTTAFDGAI